MNAAVAVERGSGNTDTDRLEYDRIINRKTVQPGEGIAIQQDHQAAAGRLIIAMANYKEATPGAQRGIVPSPRGAAVAIFPPGCFANRLERSTTDSRRYSAQSAEWRRAPGAAASLSDAAAVSIVLRSCRRNFPSAIPALELAAELSELSERARALAPSSLPRFSS